MGLKQRNIFWWKCYKICVSYRLNTRLQLSKELQRPIENDAEWTKSKQKHWQRYTRQKRPKTPGKQQTQVKKNKKLNCSGPSAFKSQRVGYQTNQKLCITINFKIISYIHIFILRIQVLGSQELKSHCHFWQGPVKSDWINFQPSCMQKIRSFRLFSFEIQSILESVNQTGHTYFWPCPTKNFLISF